MTQELGTTTTPQIAPVAPVTPVTPVTPVAQIGPGAPAAPVAQTSLTSTVTPVAPVTPVTAVAPVSQTTAVSPVPQAPRTARPGDWWRDAVIYQVYVRSFADADGDGIGDLRGIRDRLPHLSGLGVDAVWLTPFYASPQADGGYDVSDYRAVDPLFGTLDDADALVREAHRLGLRVIVDIVPNHTSDRHAWFRSALAGGPERALYHFRPGRGEHGELPPNDWESVFGGPAWTRTATPDGKGGTEWYLHLFAPEQPDLNWEHPAVREEFDAVMRFWLDLGVDGFRIDVAHGMVKADGLPDIGAREQAKMIGAQVLPFFDQDGVHEIHRSWRRLLDGYGGERIGVAEAWAPSPERLALYVRPDELHQAFNFQFLRCPWDPQRMREVVEASLAATASVGAPTTWVLSNHDVPRHTTRYGGGPVGLRRARAAALLMLALPGSVYVYQGEELGLPEVLDLPDEVRQDPSFFRAEGQDGFRDGCRVPIPWTREGTSYGFGSGGSWLPQPAEWAELSVEAQTGVPGSTLELYRAALALRREHPGLGAGADVTWLDAPEGVLAFARDGFVCTTNTRGTGVRLPVPGRCLLSSAPPELGGGTAVLPADSTVWWAI
ncbi:glycoside hydrolase family 13 protein [Streptomyces tirandamycinicus]|uniref:glycoside hydrolase family 13 protein n=1 Tax=Streptomyces tirandamycinicus TaxID=2174846 RepID=UPI00226EF027|nr:glycoside hydrolase family 13 protein [Streptomyces tirandamycinicus]MCY0984689.1 glycoside hydrolase family 13 protein [Streptomyces tirandamycinicus]